MARPLACRKTQGKQGRRSDERRVARRSQKHVTSEASLSSIAGQSFMSLLCLSILDPGLIQKGVHSCFFFWRLCVWTSNDTCQLETFSMFDHDVGDSPCSLNCGTNNRHVWNESVFRLSKLVMHYQPLTSGALALGPQTFVCFSTGVTASSPVLFRKAWRAVVSVLVRTGGSNPRQNSLLGAFSHSVNVRVRGRLLSRGAGRSSAKREDRMKSAPAAPCLARAGSDAMPAVHHPPCLCRILTQSA